ncbi:hypothetical protein IT400_00600 [Candidatus Nomurabacteria bacterium]|nr:hypothetical protein [Candidatus Nomurabacteria bacterium]
MKKINLQKLNIKKNYGAAMMIFTLFVFFISMTIIAGISRPVIREYVLGNNILDSKQAYFLANSATEDVLYRINKSKQLGSSVNLVLGTTTVTTTVTTLANGNKEILASADNAGYQRKINLTVQKGVGTSFYYGMQSGTGGITLNNSSQIIGNVYSNGPITGTGSITGTAVSANGQSATVDQTNGSGAPASDNIFGNTTNTKTIAQSFQLTNTNILSSAQIYIKKVGSPADATVTIRTDSSGKPSSTIKATGTLSTNLVSTNYGWVNINFTSNPSLTSATTYWLTVDGASASGSNYYIIGGNVNYGNGTAKIGKLSPSTWTQIGVNTDLFFSISTGGAYGSINGVTVGTAGVGNAEAHSVTNSTVAGTIYCQTGSSNNKACDTSHLDPVSANFPVSDQNITDWKDDALLGGTSPAISLSGSSTQSIGPKKITGNVTLSSNAVLTVTGVLWITGNLSISNNSIMKLDPSFGAAGGVVIVDGTVSTANSATFLGSGTTGSYMMVVSTNTGSSAISISNTAGSIILIAPYGGVVLSNSAGANQVTAKTITLSNSATITYNSGLTSSSFSTGPSGAWTVKSWKETQ